MARKRRQRDEGVPETRKQRHLTRRDRERRKMLLGLTVPLLVVAGGILVYGVWTEMVQKPNTPIAEVEGERINAGSFASRVQYERRLLLNNAVNLQNMLQSSDPSILQQFVGNQRPTVPQTAQDRLIDEAIIRHEAAKRGIEVTDADVDASIYDDLATALAPPATPVPEIMPTATVSGSLAVSLTVTAPAATATASTTPTPKATSKPLSTEEIGRQYESRVQPMLDQVEMTRAEYREIVRQQVFRERLEKALADEIPTAEKQVDLDYLLFEDDETAKAAAAALQGGDSWDEVLARFGPTPTPAPDAATATPAPSPTASTGSPAPPASPTPVPNALEAGEGGWFTSSALVSKWSLAEADAEKVLGLADGAFSEALSGGRGYYVVRVKDVQESRAVDEAELTQRKDTVLDDWLKKTKDALTAANQIKRFPLEAFVPPEPTWFSQGFDQIMATPVATIPGGDALSVSTIVPPPPDAGAAGTVAP
jgi:parvulin-like peptidyl-prolyl isomerase